MMNLQYNCPKCGARMSFNPASAQLHCSACGLEERIEGYRQEYEEFEAHTANAYFADNEARQYRCTHCGAIFITDNRTAVESCIFCGSRTGVGERTSDEPAPVRILPFRISQKSAEAAFRKWCKKLTFSPKEFQKLSKTKKVAAIYIPVWSFSLRGQGEARFEGFQTHTYTEGSKEIPEKSRYELYRQADISLSELPVNASKMLPDSLFEELEPFDLTSAKSFHARRLSGAICEKSSLDAAEVLRKAQKRAAAYMDDFLADTVTDYDDTSIIDRSYHFGETASAYTLLPVWLVFCDYNDTDYIFAMNGQTGKIACDPPISRIRLSIGFGLLALVIFILLRIITVLAGGPLL